MPRHRRLADALAGADHRDGRQFEGLELRRIEAKVGADVGEARRKCPRGPAKPLGRPEHGLVGQVDHELGSLEILHERHAVLGRAGSELLGPADEDRADPLVGQRDQRLPDHVGIVLAVDQGDRAHDTHRLALTSRSMRPVYFSYSPVRRSNWMISSCPWKG